MIQGFFHLTYNTLYITNFSNQEIAVHEYVRWLFQISTIL